MDTTKKAKRILFFLVLVDQQLLDLRAQLQNLDNNAKKRSKNYICSSIDENVMVKVTSPIFTKMKGKIGPVHFQTHGKQIRMHHMLKIRPGPTHKQREHRNRFKWAILRYRNLLPSERENLKVWARRVLKTASGYDYWTKADLAAITFETLEDREGSAPDKRYLRLLVKHPMLFHVKITSEDGEETFYDSAEA